MSVRILPGLTRHNALREALSGITLLAIAFVIINVAPANPYFVAALETWVQGKFLNFNGAAQFLSLIWPLLAFWFLFHRTHRLKRN